MENLLTVIVQTSPLPSHPSTALLEALFRSFDRVKHLKDCNIIILCDGCEDENDKDVNDTKQSKKINYKHGSINQDKVNDYLLHLDLLQQKIDNKEAPFISTNNGTIKLLKLPYRHGSARAIAAAFPINTPYVLIAQHDNFFVHDVNYLKDMLKFLDEEEETTSWLQCIHFQSTATLNYIQKIKRRYNIDLQMLCKRPHSSSLDGELIPLVFWYGRTHIARTSYYKDKILCRQLKQGDHLEELWGVKQLNEILELKKKLSTDVDNNEFETQFKMLHAPYGNYVFFDYDVNGNIQQKEVLYHMNGRKVRATTSSDKSIHSTTMDATSSSSTTQSSFNPHRNSFTTAKSTVAVVPGLEYVNDSSQTKSSKPKKKFKQNCFHCGDKGHSKKFCPKLEKDHNVTEIQHI